MIAIPLGQGTARPAAILGPYANRHCLIAGATGTGKTYTLAALSEGFSAASVPVFLCDVKGDLAGLARGAAPVQFLDVYGQQGVQVRATVRSFGAELLSRVLNLTSTQSEIMGALFATDSDRLDTLTDLSRALDRRGTVRATKASRDSIQRALIAFRAAGADSFFGGPSFDIARLERRSPDGAGYLSILAADKLIQAPALYGAFLLWLLGEVYRRAPEIGDVAAPRLVLIFDEAHLIFADASPALVRRIESTVRLIRSKGVGVYFASQSPADIPAPIAAQLSNRVQHAMRAATLADRREIQGAADCLPLNPRIRAADQIATMATGVALVSTLDATGRPTPVDVVRMRAPSVTLGPLTADERRPFMDAPGAGQGATVARSSRPAGTSMLGDILCFAMLPAIIAAFILWPKPMIVVAGVLGIWAVAAIAR